MINTAPYIIGFFNAVVWASDDGVRKSEIAAVHLNRGKWKPDPIRLLHHTQYRKHIPVAINKSPWEIDELLLSNPWEIT